MVHNPVGMWQLLSLVGGNSTDLNILIGESVFVFQGYGHSVGASKFRVVLVRH